MLGRPFWFSDRPEQKTHKIDRGYWVFASYKDLDPSILCSDFWEFENVNS